MAHDQCLICSKPLFNEMKRLSNSFKESLLESTKQSAGQSTTTDATPNSDDEDELPTTSYNDETSTYYQTEAWQMKIDQTLDSFVVPQPQQPQRLVHAFVSSHLDPCNSLLFGLPLYQIERHQGIQNKGIQNEGSDTFQYKRTYYTNIKPSSLAYHT